MTPNLTAIAVPDSLALTHKIKTLNDNNECGSKDVTAKIYELRGCLTTVQSFAAAHHQIL